MDHKEYFWCFSVTVMSPRVLTGHKTYWLIICLDQYFHSRLRVRRLWFKSRLKYFLWGLHVFVCFLRELWCPPTVQEQSPSGVTVRVCGALPASLEWEFSRFRENIFFFFLSIKMLNSLAWRPHIHKMKMPCGHRYWGPFFPRALKSVGPALGLTARSVEKQHVQIAVPFLCRCQKRQSLKQRVTVRAVSCWGPAMLWVLLLSAGRRPAVNTLLLKKQSALLRSMKTHFRSSDCFFTMS